MIRERLNTREAGNLLDEINAHRLRVNYGPHLVRVTRQDMAAWMPDVRPAEPLAIEPDAALAELLEAIRQRRPRGLPAAARASCASSRRSSTAASSTAPRSSSSRARRRSCSRNVNVFVDASVDPETLTHSRAALAQALVRAGPRRRGDARRRRRAAAAARHHRPDDRRASPARSRSSCSPSASTACASSPHTLRERHGIEAHVADGSVDERRLRAAQARASRPASSRSSASAPSRARATTSRTPR